MGGQAGSIDPSNPCSDTLRPPCTTCVALDAGAVTDGGILSQAECQSLCGGTVVGCWPIERDGRAVAITCTFPGCNLAAGRRPEGLVASSQAGARDLGAYLAEVAHLEAASVDAFRVLAAELRHHGAPPSLVRAAERAARDEVRHARVTSALARQHGGLLRRPRVEPRPLRSIEEIAIDNAVEGCVRETYGALVAMHQAEAATTARLRSAFARIAEDEVRHAALAWRVAAWLDDKLGADVRTRVRDARRAAAEELAAGARSEPPREWVEGAGLPAARTAATLVEQMTTRLWS
jgi:hypothetical protein